MTAWTSLGTITHRPYSISELRHFTFCQDQCPLYTGNTSTFSITFQVFYLHLGLGDLIGQMGCMVSLRVLATAQKSFVVGSHVEEGLAGDNYMGGQHLILQMRIWGPPCWTTCLRGQNRGSGYARNTGFISYFCLFPTKTKEKKLVFSRRQEASTNETSLGIFYLCS